jgi:hypothetical protein
VAPRAADRSCAPRSVALAARKLAAARCFQRVLHTRRRHVLEDFLHSSALHKIKPALAAKMQPHDFGAPTREQVDGAPEAGAGAGAEAEAERERRLMAQSAGLERVESGALRCKGLKPGVLLPNRGLVGYRPGLGGDGEAGEAEGEGAAEGGAAEAEADEEGLPEDPRAAETAVSIDDHPFLAGLKEGPKKARPPDPLSPPEPR